MQINGVQNVQCHHGQHNYDAALCPWSCKDETNLWLLLFGTTASIQRQFSKKMHNNFSTV